MMEREENDAIAFLNVKIVKVGDKRQTSTVCTTNRCVPNCIPTVIVLLKSSTKLTSSNFCFREITNALKFRKMHHIRKYNLRQFLNVLGQ